MSRLVALLLACSWTLSVLAAQTFAPPPRVEREFRGAWVATVDNIDWPSKPGLSTAAARDELDAVVARASQLRLNALLFQVRPAADAMYESRLEPWSMWLTGVQGKAPQPAWDPLAHLIVTAHRAGIEVHAWFNPYRARHPASQGPLAATHVANKLPGTCVTFGKYLWMDPGQPLAARWSLDVIADVVARYDIDGVHLDDYFYPYPEKGVVFADDASFRDYQRQGGKLLRDDWRRRNIDDFVYRLATETHAKKPWVKVGISPFGIARRGQPANIQAGIDQFADLYADVVKWQTSGWLDYLSPQLYWPIDQKAQSFAILLPWWLSQNKKQRFLWPGINPGRALQGKAPWRPDELAQQIELIRTQDRAPGHIHFSFKALRSDAPNVGGALRQRVYPAPALVPAATWLPGTAPPTPTAQVQRTDAGLAVSWTPATTARWHAVQAIVERKWRTIAVVGGDTGSTVVPGSAQAIALTAVGNTGLASEPRLLTPPR
ncbi:MAG: family 10 glycosylhydrolase [Planctomycetes bacterium]|nr:family 10 glycosylhydrolase [Planctomycetota bacterium]